LHTNRNDDLRGYVRRQNYGRKELWELRPRLPWRNMRTLHVPAVPVGERTGTPNRNHARREPCVLGWSGHRGTNGQEHRRRDEDHRHEFRRFLRHWRWKDLLGLRSWCPTHILVMRSAELRRRGLVFFLCGLFFFFCFLCSFWFVVFLVCVF